MLTAYLKNYKDYLGCSAAVKRQVNRLMRHGNYEL
jgi:hypothetical protein